MRKGWETAQAYTLSPQTKFANSANLFCSCLSISHPRSAAFTGRTAPHQFSARRHRRNRTHVKSPFHTRTALCVMPIAHRRARIALCSTPIAHCSTNIAQRHTRIATCKRCFPPPPIRVLPQFARCVELPAPQAQSKHGGSHIHPSGTEQALKNTSKYAPKTHENPP